MVENSSPDTIKSEGVKNKNLQGHRLRALVHTIDTLRADVPGLVGGTIYGSMLYGYVHNNSDVDMTVFIDTDIAKLPVEKTLRTETTSTFASVELRKDDQELLNNLVRSKVQAELNIPPEVDLKHIRCVPISRSIIQEEIAAIAVDIVERQKYKEAYNNWLTTAGTGISDGPPERHKFYNYPRQLASLFNPQVGLHHLDVYCVQVLNEIKRFPDIQEEIWQEIRRGAKSFENPEGYSVPPTFRIAQVMYLA